MSAFIEVKNLTKVFNGSDKRFTALDGVSFSIGKGEFVVITGKSGCGKSTLLNMLSGIDQPTKGEVFIEQIPLHQFRGNQLAEWRGRNLGIVFQFFQLMPTLTVLENVMLPMEFTSRIARSQQKGRAMELLERMDLGALAHKFPASVSGGEKQRVAIARALANNPGFIIADEPTGNLDSANSARIHQLFNSLSDEGKTIVYVTHEKDTALRYSRKIEMLDGQILNS
ncbi:MAG TPA: ABC transporter ATP-binding protein [Prolixibacteraceae bacterium]|nr:ABC transporter ATP-binding protein [Prolixibacteraceae bacterium]